MPATRYVRNGDVTLAWSAGEPRPIDVILVLGGISHVEQVREGPGAGAFFGQLESFARVILFDRRGLGLSDAVDGPITLDDEVADIEAVLDAAGSERAVVFGYSSGGPPALRFAADRPERVRALALYAAMTAILPREQLGFGHDAQTRADYYDRQAERWGTGEGIERLAPSRAGDAALREWFARMQRLSLRVGAVRRYGAQVAGQDARDVLADLRVPTLVLHRRGDRVIDLQHSRLLAAEIPGARLVELEGEDNLPGVGDSAALLGEVEEFLTGGRRRTIARELLTVLFTDIADATGHAARLGDAGWRELLAAHDAAIRRELERFGGREVKTIGDAFLATFAGPPSDAVRCAQAVVAAAHALGLDLRAGLHTGECEALGDDIGGMAVHIAARLVDLAAPGEVLCSGTTYGTVVGSGLAFEDLGVHPLKGVGGRWPVFAAVERPRG